LNNLLILSDGTKLVSEPNIMKDKASKKILEQIDLIELSPTAFMPTILNNVFFKNKEAGLSIHSLRILAVILLRLKNEQLRNKKEVTLFENEWLTEKEDSENMMMKFLLKDFIPDGSKNYSVVMQALDALAITRKVKYKNEEGEDIILTDNVLGYSYNSKKRGIHIKLRGYWLKFFIDLSKFSNEFPISMVFKLNSQNSISFYFWLKTVPLDANAPLTIENINSKFGTSFEFISRIETKLLKPLKDEFDRTSELSFNYTIENNKAFIKPYETKNAVPEMYNQEDYSMRKALIYKKKKYALSETEYSILEDMYIRYSYSVVHNSSVRKSKLVKLKGTVYIQELSELIKIYMKRHLKPFEITHLEKTYPEKRMAYNKKYYL
jgi:hypothetical protein